MVAVLLAAGVALRWAVGRAGVTRALLRRASLARPARGRPLRVVGVMVVESEWISICRAVAGVLGARAVWNE